MPSEVIAIVAARGGSVRLRGKALRPFAGRTLIGHKVRQLQQCRRVGLIYVNTDDEAIAAEAVKHGALLLDGKDYGGDSREMLADSCRQVLRRGMDTDVLWAHPTNPLVKPQTYDEAVDRYRCGLASGYDSLLSVTEHHRHAWYGGKPLNFNPKATRHAVGAELRPVWLQDGAIFIQLARRFVATRYFYGENPLAFPVPFTEGVDIDTAEDYRLALALSEGAEL